MLTISVLGVFGQRDSSTCLLLLYVHDADKILSLNIHPEEAFSFSTALDESALSDAPTPSGYSPLLLAHDQTLRTLAALESRMLAVELLRMEQDTCMAEMVLKTPSGFIRVPCRASQGILLALRCRALVRLSKQLLPHAQSVEEALGPLPKFLPPVVAAKILELRTVSGATPDDSLRASLVESALAAGNRHPDPEARQNIINAAKKILVEQGLDKGEVVFEEPGLAGNSPASENSEGEAPRKLPKVEIKLVSVSTANGKPRIITSRDIADASTDEKPTPGDPRIRVSLVRRNDENEAETLEEFHIPADGIPKEVIDSLGLSQSDAAAVNKAPAQARWATLLRILSPETKVPM